MVAFFTFTSRHNREEVTMPNAKRSNDTSAIFYFVTQRLYFLFNSTNSIFFYSENTILSSTKRVFTNWKINRNKHKLRMEVMEYDRTVFSKNI